ncbi:MAG: oligopeptide ABC transporter permease OppB [Geminicoccaceae bacterium]|nr:oligopeptide ABC transporter permease OppB [Geminicoccaceae bacterium]MCB9942088.1 oligopeptide ABC transporter permease OppB [Geminicoccaceae bacterium]
MIRFIFKRLMTAIPTMFVIITVAFFLMRLAPGGPFSLERPLPPQVLANLMAYYHLDQPLWAQYLDYLKGLFTGHLGPSYVYRDFTVDELLLDGLPVSVQLGLSALVLATLIGCTLGTIAALRQNRAADYGVMTIALIGIVVPNFVMAPALTLLFSIHLGWLPAGGWGEGALVNKILPIFALALPQIAVISRLTRGSMIEVMRSNHIRTALAYGLPQRVVIGRALRGALLPVVSYLGPAAAALLTGSVVIESIFGVPGIGRHFVQGALNRDYTLVMGTVVTVAVFVVVFNLVVDILYAWLDPKVRLD